MNIEYVKPIPIILSSGMQRSGSTLMYNMIRLILESKYDKNFVCGWIDDISFDKITKTTKLALIKTHSMPPNNLLSNCKHIFWSHRDIRTILISQNKKFKSPITLQEAKKLICEGEKLSLLSNTQFRYNQLTETPLECISTISKALDISVDEENIYKQILSVVPPLRGSYDKTTLYHREHLTHTEDDEWRRAIPLELQTTLSKDFDWWFDKYQYPKI